MFASYLSWFAFLIACSLLYIEDTTERRDLNSSSPAHRVLAVTNGAGDALYLSFGRLSQP